LEQFCGRISKLLKKILKQLDRVESEAKTAVNGVDTTSQSSQKSADLEAILHTFFMVVITEFVRSFEAFKASRQAIDDIEICLDEFIAEFAEKKSKSKGTNKAAGNLEFPLIVL
jgi:histone H3/H4